MKSLIIVFIIIFNCHIAPSLLGQTSFDNLYQKGDLNLKEGNYVEAINYFNSALTIQPKSDKILLLRATAYNQLEKYDLALEDYLKIYETNKTEEIITSIGSMYYNLENYKNARQFFTLALNQSPRNFKYLYNIGLCFQNENDHQNAISYFDKILIMDEEYIPAIREKARSLFSLERFDESLKIIETLFNRKKFDLDCLNIRADIYSQKEMYELALNDFYKILALEKEKPITTTLIKTANTLNKLKSYNEEIVLRKIILNDFIEKKRDIELIDEAYYDLAIALNSVDDSENALDALNKISQNYINNSGYLFLKCILFAKLDKFEIACQNLNSAINNAPEDTNLFLEYLTSEFEDFMKYCKPNK